jgi:hypothetical protein
MGKERLYHLRFRSRDNTGPYELYQDAKLCSTFELAYAQSIADQLWEKGYSSSITALGTEWDNTT